MLHGRLLSVNVGLPRDVDWRGRTVHTGIHKRPVDGPTTVRRLNLDSDGQGDLAGHGGGQRAVLVYQRESLEHWVGFLGRDDLTPGAFGENLTVEGLADDQVCLGDRFRIGEAEFEVTQPRVTCFRVGLRLGEPRMPSLLVAHHRPGFYLRVLTEGQVCAGDAIVQTASGPERISVAEADALLYLPGRDRGRLAAAARVPALSPGWRQSFRELLADAGGVGSPGWPGFRRLTVRAVTPESPDVVSVSLGLSDEADLPPVRPGQYLTLRVPAMGDRPPVRNYSLSAVPDARTWRVSVKREGTVSRFLHDHAAPGWTLEAAAPRGTFVLETGDRPVVLVSAGIGATPVLAMLHRLADTHSPSDVWWLHSARRPADHVFATEAHELLTRLPRAHECVFYSRRGAEQSRVPAVDARLDAVRIASLGLPADAVAYVCGPEAFTVMATAALTRVGIDPADVHTEQFAGRTALTPGIAARGGAVPHPPAGPVGTGPVVTFARSGLSVPWRDEQRTLLEQAEACDVPTRWSCRSGVCHTCQTAVVSGEVDYVQPPLEPSPDGVLICCARPAGEVVLDL